MMLRQIPVWVGLLLVVCLIAYFSQMLSISASTERRLIWQSKVDVTRGYREYYDAFSEDSLLSSKSMSGEVYRFGLLRSFDGFLVVVIDLQNRIMTIKATKTNEFPPLPPGLIRTVMLSQEELFDFKQALEASRFLNAAPESAGSLGLDGAFWVFEVVRDGDYAGVEQWSPTKGALCDIGTYVFGLASRYVPLGELY